MFHRGVVLLATIGMLLAPPVALAFSEESASSAEGATMTGTIEGRVLDKDTGEPLYGTNIVVVGTRWGNYSFDSGEYTIGGLPPGEYAIEFSYIGYETERIQRVQVAADALSRLDVELKPKTLRLSEVVVTPGQFAVMGGEATVRQALTRQDLETIPLGEDIYRAVTRLPGVSSGDFSAKFTVRGGKNENVLVLMDGQQLYEPFHLKDIDGGALSIVDVEAVEGINLYTGGYPAEYGECLSGVLNMRSTDAGSRKSRTSLGVSLMNASLMSEGHFGQDRGSWLISARRGYLDLVLALMEEEDPPEPVYYDVFGKVRYAISGTNTLTASILHSGDRLDFVEDEQDGFEDDRASTTYGNSYGWLTLRSVLTPRLAVRTIGSLGRITLGRNGIGYSDMTGEIDYTVDDDTSVRLFGLTQDWDFEMSERYLMKWGWYYSNERAEYDYLNTVAHRDCAIPDSCAVTTESTSAVIDPEGDRFGGYVSNRLRIAPPLTFEFGLRYDRNGYTDDEHLDPRLGVVYWLGKQTSLRAAWGYFHQSQRMHEIAVAYGESDFYPAESARHWVAGLEHTLRNGLNLRLEGYYKEIFDLTPAHHMFNNSIELFPEVEDDIYTVTFDGARSKGLELYAKYHREGKWSCWGSYALSRVDDDARTLIFQGVEYPVEGPDLPSRYDQRHAVHLDINYHPNPKWDMNVSWKYHTGWPYTPQVLYSEEMPDGSTQCSVGYAFRGATLPAYHRMDVQIRRHFGSSRNRVSVFLALINLYNRSNVRNIKYNTRLNPDGSLRLVGVEEYWFGLLPSVGVRWTWGS
jgi:outer membrane receptor protein involved in Fe transport